MKKKLLGYVEVDSGMLVVCDPCYIDSEWKQEDFKDIRIHQHATLKSTKFPKKKHLFAYNSSKKIKNLLRDEVDEFFDNYESKTSTGKTMNEMEASKECSDALKVPEKLKSIGHFSYVGSCETTMANQHQLNYKLGHPGVGVVFNSGYGDGCYKIYGYFNKDNRCVKVEIIMK